MNSHLHRLWLQVQLENNDRHSLQVVARIFGYPVSFSRFKKSSSQVVSYSQPKLHAMMAGDLKKKWEKHGKVWQLKYFWLEAADDLSGLGCIVCKNADSLAARKSPWSTFAIAGSSAQPSCFAKHEQSDTHQGALKRNADEMSAGKDAPSIQDFAKVVSATWKGDGSVDGVAQAYKFRNMQYCIAEAVRVELRKAVQRAEVISLQQDVRDGQLLVSFTASLSDLTTCSGFLGQCRLGDDNLGLKARGLYNGTILILQEFATSGLGTPERSGQSGLGKIDQAIVDVLKNKVELIAADAASDETLAGKMLKSYFQNIKIRAWDKAHATKRVLKRTWAADEFMKQTANDLVLGDLAICQKVRYSSLFKAKFEQAIGELTGNACRRIKDLSSASHRFTSHSAPFRRTVLFFVPLIRVAQFIIDSRDKNTEEAQSAIVWLSRLDGERALMIGLMADASDESLELNRWFDSDKWDIAQITGKTQDFLARVTWLFERDGAMTTGMTQFMMDTLQTLKTFFIDGRPHVLKAPTEEQKSRCLQRMRNWLTVCRKAIQSDFPDFEALQNFTALNLECRNPASKLQCLARVVGVDFAALKNGLDQLRPTALWHYRNGSPSSSEAWRKAFEDSRTSCPTLKSVLFRYMAFQPGTSAIERVFGKVHLSSHRWRGDVSELRVSDELQLHSLLARGKDDEVPPVLPKYTSLLEAAQAIWRCNWGTPKARTSVGPTTGWGFAKGVFPRRFFLSGWVTLAISTHCFGSMCF